VKIFLNLFCELCISVKVFTGETGEYQVIEKPGGADDPDPSDYELQSEDFKFLQVNFKYIFSNNYLPFVDRL
jgi:hypothetical protein